MLWIALHFHTLPLEIFSRAASASDPLAVFEREGNRSRVLVCNEAAGALGVKPGMPVSAAQALADESRGARARHHDGAGIASRYRRLGRALHALGEPAAATGPAARSQQLSAPASRPRESAGAAAQRPGRDGLRGQPCLRAHAARCMAAGAGRYRRRHPRTTASGEDRRCAAGALARPA